MGQKFSYSYSIPCAAGEGKAAFKYTNHTQGGTFHLTDLAWVSCTRSDNVAATSDPDIITFSGFGSWRSKDPGKQLHVVAAQFSNAVGRPYVGIQIDSGATSNVNTKPKDDRNLEGTLP